MIRAPGNSRGIGRSDLQGSGLKQGDSQLPDLTAMLDILFILLVFFLLTAGTAFHTLDLTLPATKSDSLPVANKTKTILLEVQKVGYMLDKKPIADLATLEQTLPEVLEAEAGSKLIVAGDKEISIERLLEVLTYLRVSGIKAADILMTNKTD